MVEEMGKVAIIGAGKMGETLLRGVLEAGVLEVDQVIATARHQARLDLLEERIPGIETSLDNVAAVEAAHVVLLCVKPQAAERVLAEIRDALTPNHILISILASVTTEYLERHIEEKIPVIRSMPNTPSLIGSGMAALCGGTWADDSHLELAEAFFAPLGRTMALDEKHFDAVTGLSASGPAFIYIIIESLADGGVKVGLPRKVAIELAAQTCLGAANMVLETGQHPALLKDAVTTPAGCTVDGILKLEEGGGRVTLIKAIVEAATRAGDIVND